MCRGVMWRCGGVKRFTVEGKLKEVHEEGMAGDIIIGLKDRGKVHYMFKWFCWMSGNNVVVFGGSLGYRFS